MIEKRQFASVDTRVPAFSTPLSSVFRLDGNLQSHRNRIFLAGHAERNEASERPSVDFFRSFSKTHWHMRKTTRANSISFHPHSHSLSPFPPLSFFDLWMTTINSSRNHAATVRPSYSVVLTLSYVPTIFLYKFLLFLYGRRSIDSLIRRSPTPSPPL